MAQYVVKAGDSYAKIAGQKLGDQRGFGDLARLNGYRMLRPGDVIEIPGQRRQDYFVSDKDVQFAQQSTNANYKGPTMQRYGDYQANYAAAQAAGQAGVYGAQNFTGAGGNAGAPGGGVSINWQKTPTPSQGGDYYNPDVGSMTQATPQVTNAQQAQAAFQQQTAQAAQAKQANLNNVVIPGGGNLDATAGNQRVGEITPDNLAGIAARSFVSGLMNMRLSPSQITGALGKVASGVLGGLTGQPATSPSQSATSSNSAVSTQVQELAYQNQAQATATALSSNTNVPTSIQKGAVFYLGQMAALDPELAIKLSSLYDWDDNGNLVAKGSLLLPGAKADLTTPDPSIFVPDTYDYVYSNVPPYGYDSRGNVYSTTGRRARGGRPTGTKTTGSGRYFTKDYSVRLGQ